MIGSQQALAYVVLTGLVRDGGGRTGGRQACRHVTSRGAALGACCRRCLGGRAVAACIAALRIGKVGVVAPIASSEGALAAVFSVIFLGEQLSLGVALALAVVACGVVLVTFHGTPVRRAPAARTAGRELAAVVFGFGLVGELAGWRRDRALTGRSL